MISHEAGFDETGLFRVKPFSLRHRCEYGRVFLCKGQALKDYLNERSLKDGKTFSRIVYLGDGKNDYCPMADLDAGDLACVRKDSYLDEFIETAGPSNGTDKTWTDGVIEDQDGTFLCTRRPITAKILRWDHGHQVMKELNLKLDNLRNESTK